MCGKCITPAHHRLDQTCSTQCARSRSIVRGHHAAASACRAQQAHLRYRDGLTQLQAFASHVTDAVVQCVALEAASQPPRPTEEEFAAHSHFRDSVLHLASLLHALGLANLRRDLDLDGFEVRRRLRTQLWTNALLRSFKPACIKGACRSQLCPVARRHRAESA